MNYRLSSWVCTYFLFYQLKAQDHSSHRVVDVEGSVLVSCSDVKRKQGIPSTVCVACIDSGHRGVYGGTLTHIGFVRQVKKDWVIVINVPNVDPDHHLKQSDKIN